MQRDMDLIRQILLVIEEFPYYKLDENGQYKFVKIDLNGFSKAEINYHVHLLVQSKLIEVTPKPEITNVHPSYALTALPSGKIVGLTWKGHEFLDLMKQETAWNKAKDAMKATGGMAFEVLIRVLAETATKIALGQIQ